MNERIRELANQIDWSTDTTYDELTKFAQAIYKDIITVVAAQALLNESALDVFKNLQRIYQGVEE